MMPAVARLVRYCLSEMDVQRLQRYRTIDAALRLRLADPETAHAANVEMVNVVEGDVFPMLIVRVNEIDGTVNGQVFLDGPDVLWVAHVAMAGVEVPGTWRWPDNPFIALGGPMPGAPEGAEP